jgi:hypothetical protein
MEATRTVQKIGRNAVKRLLKNGVTRLKADDLGFGSIEEKYALSPAAVKRLFQDDELKGLKTIVPEFELVDDEQEEEDMDDIMETPEEVHTDVRLRQPRGSFAGNLVEYPATIHPFPDEVENVIETTEIEDTVPNVESLFE